MAATPSLRQVAYLSLLCLAERPVHGYGLAREIERRTRAALRPGPASIHRTLGQLLDAGLIVESTERPDPAIDDPRRKYYRATEKGRAVLAAETARWRALVEQAAAALADET